MNRPDLPPFVVAKATAPRCYGIDWASFITGAVMAFLGAWLLWILWMAWG